MTTMTHSSVRIQRWTLLAATIAGATLFTSCGRAPQIDPVLPGVTITVPLQPDSTVIWLEDYLMDPSVIRDLAVPEGLRYALSDDGIMTLYGQPLKPLDLLEIQAGETTYAIPLKRSLYQKRTLRYRPSGSSRPGSVQLKGEMNSWNPAANPMQWDGNAFTTEFYVKPGTYQYLFVVDGREIHDPANPVRVSNGLGGTNNLLSVERPTNAPEPRVRAEQHTPGGVTVSAWHTEELIALWQSKPADVQEVMDAAADNAATDNATDIATNVASDADARPRTFQIRIPAEARTKERSELRLWAIGEGGVSHELVIPLTNGVVATRTGQLARKDPRSWRMYFILIDRFRDGNPENNAPLNDPEVHPKADFHGGDLSGITQMIREGYFDRIGVNALWLSPIAQNPEGAYGLYPEPLTKFSAYHGYWPISSSRIDPRFGTEEDFRELLATAHRHGISVVLDYVANHVHELHPVLAAHPDWKTDLYLPDGSLNTERWDEYRLTTWFDVFMPTLDFSRPEVVETMTDSALFWVQTYDLDGFRHDATKHIQTEFWRTLTRKMKEQVIVPQDRSLYQVGETYGSRELIASYIGTGLLDAQFDFSMYDAGLAAFARGESMQQLRSQLEQSFEAFGVHNTMGYISGNHDKPRFITLASGEVSFSEDAKYAGWTRQIGYPQPVGYRKHSLNLAFIHTIPGIPVLYQGDEFGMPGANDPDNRRMMIFDEAGLIQPEREQRDLTIRLAKLRAASMPLTYGDLRFLHSDEHTLAFQRRYFEQAVSMFFNNSETEQTVVIPASEFEASVSETGEFTHLKRFNGHPLQVQVGDGGAGATIRLRLPPQSFEIIEHL